jgi:hypothetical protein
MISFMRPVEVERTTQLGSASPTTPAPWSEVRWSNASRSQQAKGQIAADC